MEDLEIVLRAKSYIDKLANGINPLTGEPVSQEDVVNDVRISRCLFYVSDLLRQVAANGGTVRKGRRSSFCITDEELSRFEFSDTPIPLSHVVARINENINRAKVRGLSYNKLSDWLVQAGMLEKANGQFGLTKKIPTEMGKEMGLTMEKRRSQRGEYYAVFYNRTAQQFIIDNIQSVYNNK